MAKGGGRVRSYGAVAWCYDEIAAFYSLGQIGQAKASQVALLEAGECVLYAGVGRGEEALLAAQGGARVTALDSSPAMLARLRRALAREGAQARLVCGDVFDHAPGQPYDVVVANFFLNVFSPDEMRRALRHLVSLVRTGGRVMIADFAPPQGSAAARLVTRVYYRPVSLAAFASRLAALHPIYDYAREFETLGLELIRRDEFRLASWTPVLFESLVARRC